MALQVFQQRQRRLHGARLDQRALRGLHQGGERVVGLAPRQPPGQVGLGVELLDGRQLQRQPRVQPQRLQRAPHQPGELAALPRGQHIGKRPGDAGTQQGVAHAFEQREGGAAAGVQHVRLHQPQYRGGHRRDHVAPQREGVRHALRGGEDQHQRQRARVQRQQAGGQQAAHQRAGHALVAPLQRLRQAAAQHHHDGQRHPVIVRAPGQQRGDHVARAHGQRRTQGVAQCRLVPVPDVEEGLQRPVGGADEQAPAVAHHIEIGRGLAARQGRELQHRAVLVRHAEGHAAQQAREQAALVGGGVFRRGRQLVGGAGGLHRQLGQPRTVVGGGYRLAAEQQGVGDARHIGGHGAVDVGHAGQHGLVAGVVAHALQVQLAGDQVVAHFQHHHQHAGQALPVRRAGRLQHHIARGLQLVGQRGLAP